MLWPLTPAPSVPIPAPPLIDSTLLGIIVTTIGSIILLVLGARLNRRQTSAEPPAPTGSALAPHDVEIASKVAVIDSKLNRDYERLNRIDADQRDQAERLRAIEHRLGITPDPNRHTGGSTT